MCIYVATYVPTYFKTANIKFICINSNHAVFVRFTFVHVCLHLCRLINLHLAKLRSYIASITAGTIEMLVKSTRFYSYFGF